MSPAVDPAHQLVILTRLSEYCRYRPIAAGHLRVQDPWSYMRDKLLETEQPLTRLKEQLLSATTRRLLAEMRERSLDQERCSDYMILLERLLSRGDYSDVALHLSPESGPANAKWLEGIFARTKPFTLFAAERQPPLERPPAWERLVSDMGRRLRLELLSRIWKRGKPSARRRRMVLRRLRRAVAQYCEVVRIPSDPSETFTPFMLPRVEALIAANLRFLNEHRA